MRALESKRVLVTGAGGFIGGHLAKRLYEMGHIVYGADIKYPEFREASDIVGPMADDRFIITDLRDRAEAIEVMLIANPDWVFALAADMGGMGFIADNDYQILSNNLAINANTLDAAIQIGTVEKYFFSSSVCVYPEEKQMDMSDFTRNMRESDAYPANPQDAYGWEKLTAENLLLAAHEDLQFPCYIARFHNCYGPYGTWRGGREKAPAALCRKFAEGVLKQVEDEPIPIEIWGDGKQIRPFVYVDDLVEGILKLVHTDYHQPVNLGPTWQMYQDYPDRHIVSIDTLAHIIADVAYITNYTLEHVDGPEGVRYRGADSTKMQQLTGWKPVVPLAYGLSVTFEWIREQLYNHSEVM